MIAIAVGCAVALFVTSGAAYLVLRPAGTASPVTAPAAAATSSAPGQPPDVSIGPSSARPVYGPDKLPDLVGLPEAEARSKLPPSVAVQIVHQKAPDGTPDGVVLAQDPQPGADLPSTLELTVASRLATQYLADLTPAAGDDLTTGNEAANYKLSGHTQVHAIGVSGDPCYGSTGTAEYDLGQHYNQFIGLAGLDDNSPAAKSQVTLEIFGDQRKLKSMTVGLGHPKPLNVVVTGVLRLSLRWEFTGGDASSCDGGTLVLGDAQLVAAAGYAPPVTAEPSASE
jgi:serine/threonine-protein kinase